ncbi:mercuric reductase [Stachybotrys elegans]|uniref:Mercuric reductase n=1 Tax=Stachybotrys elegans TaxID=80388 RepID=A0A8K0SNC1_9HYPO|nr:mercuric reductase [Stachybotrys elegans]
MATPNYKVLFIGSGQSANPLAKAFSKAGRKTAMIERSSLGGTCVNVGCTPTKTMIASGRAAYMARRAGDYGVPTNVGAVDMARVRQRKRDIVTQWHSGSVRGLKEAGVDVIMGDGAFVGNKTVKVALNDGGETTISAELVFIPGLDGVDAARVLNSTTIMELDQVPSHLLVMGGGYIGLEFGQLFRRLGAEVTVVQRGKQLVPREDEDVAECLREILVEDGITVHLSSTVTSVSSSSGTGKPLKVEVQTSKGPLQLDASHLLLAAGRVANTDGLNLSVAGVETDSRGHILVNELLQTTAPDIYALGDVHGGPAFTHMSYDDFRIIRSNLLPETIPPPIPPWQTRRPPPRLGHVGLHARDLRGRKTQTAVMPMSYVARAAETNEPRGMMKATVDAETGEILGFTCIGVEGGEIMSMVQMAMMGGLKWWDLEAAVWAHPTWAESLNNLWASLK